MPYRLEWFSAPTNMDLEVLESPPEGAQIMHLTLGGPKEVYFKGDAYYMCRRCGGWIKGTAGRYKENTLGPLSGRRGTAYHCIRCGDEIAFLGVMS